MKEPKLLAVIRANAARTEKAAKRALVIAPASGPQFVGTVETPAKANPPNNYLTQVLAECTTAEHCQALLAHADAHGYDRKGQTVQLIRQRMAELKGGTAKPIARKRRGAR